MYGRKPQVLGLTRRRFRIPQTLPCLSEVGVSEALDGHYYHISDTTKRNVTGCSRFLSSRKTNAQLLLEFEQPKGGTVTPPAPSPVSLIRALSPTLKQMRLGIWFISLT